MKETVYQKGNRKKFTMDANTIMETDTITNMEKKPSTNININKDSDSPNKKKKPSISFSSIVFCDAIYIFLFLSILFFEVLFRIVYTGRLSDGTIYSFNFAIPMAGVFSIFILLFKNTLRKIVFYVTLILLSAITFIQIVYTRTFNTMLVISSIRRDGLSQAVDFRNEAISAIQNSIWILLLVFLPILFAILLRKYLFTTKTYKYTNMIITTIIVISLHIISVFSLNIGGNESNSAHTAYFGSFNINIAHDNLGLFTAERLDLKYSIFGAPEVSLGASSTISPVDFNDNTAYNIMDINVESLMGGEDEILESLHNYVNAKEPTNKNDFTGMFKDYNLVYICAEGFSEYVISPELTPTLYKMKSEGFNFTNFYNPIWDVSTSDGEYVSLTGLLPISGLWTFSETGERGINMFFTMGKQFERLGYVTNAYHNHTYSYYNRDESHPNMGYNYKGIGNGLNVAEVWPASDFEMMQKSVHEWIDNEKFHTYYLTMSGHLHYTYTGNTQVQKNWDVVDDLPYTDLCKGYLSCNYELEKAVAYLVEELENAGKMDNTLIVLTSDHYPYGLIQDGNDYSAFSEFIGHEADTNFEIFRNDALIWSSSMTEPVVVDEYCSSIDLIPTISNLLGLEYDSRLLVGTDVFSSTDNLVVFNNKNWISQECMYIKSTGEIIPLNNKTPNPKHITDMNERVEQMFLVSELIIKYDYYNLLFSQ